MLKTTIRLCALAAVASLAAGTVPAVTQPLDVEVMETSDGELDTCILAEVRGLKAGGDGFLAVRSGPGTDFRKLDELYNGDQVWIFEERGKWMGIVYNAPNLSCFSDLVGTHPVPYQGRKGWVHQNWIVQIAG